MSAATSVTITCDHRCMDCDSGCPETYVEVTDRSVGAVRARARGEGWVKRRYQGELIDLCPEHHS